MFGSESGNRKYIIAADRMISALVLVLENFLHVAAFDKGVSSSN